MEETFLLRKIYISKFDILNYNLNSKILQNPKNSFKQLLLKRAIFKQFLIIYLKFGKYKNSKQRVLTACKSSEEKKRRGKT